MSRGAAPPMAQVVTIPAEAERQFTAQVGMLIFLGSWAMMFGALFFSYALLRLRSTAWPPPGVKLPILLPILATLLIVASEGAFEAGLRAVKRQRGSLLLPWLLASAALGTAFLAVQCATWAGLWRAGLTQASGTFGSIFYLLTVFHALHVLCGLGLVVSGLPGAARQPYDVRRQSRLRLVGMFWHFVGVAWVLMFVSIYLL